MLVPLTTGAALLSGGANLGDLALKTIESYATPAFYLGDQNPALRMPSGLRRGYQDFSNTPVTASTQTAALALDLSEGAAISGELFSAANVSLVGDAVDNMDGSYALIDAGDRVHVDNTIVSGGLFRITTSHEGGALGLADGGIDIAGSLSAGVNIRYHVFANTQLRVYSPTASACNNVTISIERIAGYHFYQPNSADEPTLNLTNGLYGYLGDGASKHFRTGLVPASSMTMMAAMNAPTASDDIMGANDGSNTNACRFGIDANGLLAAGVGAQLEATINGGSDIRGISGVAALRITGSQVSLWWRPIAGALSKIYDAAQSGSPTSTNALFVAARNAAGTPARYLGGTIWRALAQQSAYTDAEIAAIANQWSRELAALA